MFLMRLVNREAYNEHQPDGCAEHTICDIESGPVFTRPIKNINKIAHESVIEHSVIKISADAGCKKRQSNVDDSTFCAVEKKDE